MRVQINLFFTFFLIVLFSKINFINAVKSHHKDRLINKTSVFCIGKESCEHVMGEGSDCVDNYCVCKDKEKCEKNVQIFRAKANSVDEQCATDENCNIEFSKCVENYCVCDFNKVPSENKRHCLEVAEGLGYPCKEDVQCISTEKDSICKNRKCVCNEMTHEYDNSCWPNIGLGGKCTLNAECSHIPLSKCNLMFCECTEGYVASKNKDNCLPIAMSEKDICEEAVQCHHLYGNGGICNRNECQCDPNHSVVNSKCPSKLKKYCETDDECKLFKDDLSMRCDNGRCECAPTYEEIDGTCNGGLINHASTLILTIIQLISFIIFSTSFVI